MRRRDTNEFSMRLDITLEILQNLPGVSHRIGIS
jgi:hypothetical protein